jgi:hypothetical protein
LNGNLDHTSFRKGTASHPYKVHFEEDDILIFTFENILLPDSNVNEPASNGHVSYYIEHNGILPFGATISNTASIYFDFNAPVITNTVSNKIDNPVGVKGVYSATDNISVYPNPNDGKFIVQGISLAETDWILELHSLEGKRLFSQLIVKQKELSFSFKSKELVQGIYLLKVENSEGANIKKVVIQ